MPKNYPIEMKGSTASGSFDSAFNDFGLGEICKSNDVRCLKPGANSMVSLRSTHPYGDYTLIPDKSIRK
jgi:hypothetical protein